MIPGIPAAGERFAGKYRVERVIGSGGMGVVIAAEHIHLREHVAIKILRGDVTARPEAVARFVREARMTMRLRNEHVVRVYDVDLLAGGVPYIVMELLEGRDLGRYLVEHGPLPVLEAVSYALDACEGVAEAHARGIVHRDLKPANLFRTSSDDGPLIKVLDFGVSKATDLFVETGSETEPSSERRQRVVEPVDDAGLVERTSAAPIELTHTNATLGSPRYMPPEQLRSPRDVDARSDVWAIGAILYEMLGGSAPFDGANVDVLSRTILEDAPVPIRKRRPDVPAKLAAVVERCLQKDPALRFADVDALALALVPFGPSDARASAERIAGALSAPRRAPPTVGARARRYGSLLGLLALVSASTLAFRARSRATPASAHVEMASAPPMPATSAPELATSAPPPPSTAATPVAMPAPSQTARRSTVKPRDAVVDDAPTATSGRGAADASTVRRRLDPDHAFDEPD